MSVCLRNVSFEFHPTDSDRDVQSDSRLFLVLGGEMDIWRQRQVLQRDADTNRWTLNDPIYLSALDIGWEIMIRFTETTRFARIVRFTREQLSDTDVQQVISTKSSTMSFRVEKLHSPELSLSKPTSEEDIHLLLEDYIHAARSGQLADTSLLHKVILSLPDQHPNKGLFLNVLGQIWQKNYPHSEDPKHIDIAVNLMQEALDHRPKDDLLGAFYAFHLAEAIQSHNPKLENPIDLDKRISAFEEALHLVGDRNSRRFLWLEELSREYCLRYTQRGTVDDLSSAISTLERAIQATPEHHLNRAFMLTNLGDWLEDRFMRFGDPADLNRSIEVLEVACTLSPPWEFTDVSHWVAPSVKLRRLGLSLFRRAGRQGSLDDLLRSISFSQKAIDSSTGDEKLLALHNIAMAKSRLFERTNNIEHLNQAIETLEKAEKLPARDLTITSNLQATLGHLLRLRFSRDHGALDINRSISLLERVISDAAGNSEVITHAQIQLAGSFIRQFDRTQDLRDLDSSISMYESVVEKIPDGDLDKSRLRSAHAAALLTRYEYQFERNLLNEDDPSIDVKTACLQYYQAALSDAGHPMIRFRAAFLCAKFLGSLEEETLNQHILDGYGTAIKIIPELAWLGLSVSDRHHNLLRAQSIVREAAASAMKQSKYAMAVEWLEEGRSVIWGQLLQLRSPIDKLKDENHELGERFMALSRQLQGAQWSETGDILPTERLLKIKHDIDYHSLALQRKNLIQEIQNLPGFENLFSPRSYSQLEGVARNGPVIVLNTCYLGCDALIVTSGGLRHIPLTSFTEEDAIKLYNTLRLLLINNQRSILSNRKAKQIPDLVTSGDSNAIFKHILSVLWLRVVKPVVEDLALVAPANGPTRRIWWCLTGHLAFLPIHAAGVYDGNAPLGSKLSDYAVSSYTPTLTALLNCHEKQPLRRSQMLVVAQPSVPGFLALPGTRREAERIKQCIKTSGLPLLSLIDGTEEEVIKSMERSSWVHFACHGTQDTVHPTQSALILKGGVPLTLSKISQLSLNHAELAFLSACQTATGDEVMSEEAVHLAAGMLLAGYRGVIATMWSILDNEAPQVASEVYSRFFDSVEPDSSQAAYFLQAAVQKLREEKKSFLSWVPFVHYGF